MSDAATTERPSSAAPPRKQDLTPLREVTRIGDLFTNADFVRRIERAVPSIITPQMMLSSLAGSLRKSPTLSECSVADVAGKALMLAQVGLLPDTALQSAHLIPFRERFYNRDSRQFESRMVCQLVLGYHGLLDLAYRSGKVASLIGRVAWRDEVDARMFEFEFGSNEHLRHVPSSAMHDLSPQAQASGSAELPAFAYAQATLSDGRNRPFEVWPMNKVLAIRNGTPAYQFAAKMLNEAKAEGKSIPAAYSKAPWVANLEKMAAKTMARQLMNWLPRSIELATIAAFDGAQESRSIDLGPIIDSTDYVAAAADAAEMSGDPGAAFGYREDPAGSTTPTSTPQADNAPGPAGTRRTGQSKVRERTPRQPEPPPPQDQEPPPNQDDRWSPPANDAAAPAARAPTAAATASPPTNQGTGSVSPDPVPVGGAAWLEQWLLDENGEPVGERPISSPLDFARQLEALWAKSTRQETLLEQNADGMGEAIRADSHAAEIIASLQAPTDEELVVQIPVERGSQNLAQYLRDFKSTVAMLKTNGYLDFVSANLEMMRSVPMSTRSLAVKALIEQADKLGVTKPVGLIDIMQPPAQPAAAPATPQDQMDRRQANNILEELGRCADHNQISLYANNKAVSTPRARWKAEGKDALVKEIEDAFNKRYVELGGKLAQP